MGSLIKNIKRLIALAIGLLLVAALVAAFYFLYLDSNTSVAKKYLVETYGLNEKELRPKKYIQYVYEDITNCESEWIKKCTDNEDLAFEYVFAYNNETIVVSEDKKGHFTDDTGFRPIKPVEDNKQDDDNEENKETSE